MGRRDRSGSHEEARVHTNPNQRLPAGGPRHRRAETPPEEAEPVFNGQDRPGRGDSFAESSVMHRLSERLAVAADAEERLASEQLQRTAGSPLVHRSILSIQTHRIFCRPSHAGGMPHSGSQARCRRARSRQGQRACAACRVGQRSNCTEV